MTSRLHLTVCLNHIEYFDPAQHDHNRAGKEIEGERVRIWMQLYWKEDLLCGTRSADAQKSKIKNINQKNQKNQKFWMRLNWQEGLLHGLISAAQKSEIEKNKKRNKKRRKTIIINFLLVFYKLPMLKLFLINCRVNTDLCHLKGPKILSGKIVKKKRQPGI